MQYMTDNNYHVYKRGNEWVVKKTYSEHAEKVCLNKSVAVNYAVKLASKYNSRVIIHYQDMRVEKII